MPCYHMAQSHDEAEVVFRESWNEKEKKRKKQSPVFQKEIVFLDDLRLYRLLNEWQAKKSGKRKGQPRTYRQTDGGVYCSEDGSINVTAYETGYFSWYGGCYYLQDLKGNENKFVIGIRLDKCDYFIIICEERIQVIVNKKIG